MAASTTYRLAYVGLLCALSNAQSIAPTINSMEDGRIAWMTVDVARERRLQNVPSSSPSAKSSWSAHDDVQAVHSRILQIGDVDDDDTDDEHDNGVAMGWILFYAIVTVVVGICGGVGYCILQKRVQLTDLEPFDCPLCFFGSSPLIGCCVISGLDTMWPFFVSPTGMRLLRFLGVWELTSIATAVVGIKLLKQRTRLHSVPRGCDFCCTCPFPAWSLLLQLLDPLFVVGYFIASGDGGELYFDIMYSVLRFINAVCDLVFCWSWLKALQAQDGDVCCGQSKAGAAPGFPVIGIAETIVVGVPTGVQTDVKPANVAVCT